MLELNRNASNYFAEIEQVAMSPSNIVPGIGFSPGRVLQARIFNGPKQDPRFAEPPLPLHGAADRYDHRSGNDDFIQPGNLFRLLDTAQKQRLFDNIAAAMQGVPESIVRRQLALFTKCDPAYGDGVRRALKLDPIGKGTSATDEAKESDTVSV